MKGRVFLRNLALFGGYSLMLAGALWLSLQLRFDFQPSPYLARFLPSLLLLLAICLPCLWFFGQFRALLSFFSLPDARRIVFATRITHTLLFAVCYVAGRRFCPAFAGHAYARIGEWGLGVSEWRLGIRGWGAGIRDW